MFLETGLWRFSRLAGLQYHSIELVGGEPVAGEFMRLTAEGGSET
jgi:hypothetical protein